MVIDFMEYPWAAFAAWGMLAVVALALSCSNAFRYRSFRYFAEVASEVFVLASFHNRLLHLFGRGI
jgi:hypothetical protein